MKISADAEKSRNLPEHVGKGRLSDFFGRLKTAMQVGETFKAVKVFERKFRECICSFNKERIYWRERVQFNAGLVPCADTPSGAWGMS